MLGTYSSATHLYLELDEAAPAVRTQHKSSVQSARICACAGSLVCAFSHDIRASPYCFWVMVPGDWEPVLRPGEHLLFTLFLSCQSWELTCHTLPPCVHRRVAMPEECTLGGGLVTSAGEGAAGPLASSFIPPAAHL